MHVVLMSDKYKTLRQTFVLNEDNKCVYYILHTCVSYFQIQIIFYANKLKISKLTAVKKLFKYRSSKGYSKLQKFQGEL